jgi:hypothetical protein
MSNIRVIVRPRPVDELKKEKAAPGLEFLGRRIILGSKTYDPDVILPATSTNAEIFEMCAPILSAVKEGTNGTIMVYGQTGTGKTHTMLGSDRGGEGVAFACLGSLYDAVRTWTLEGRRVALSLSVLEIYQERVTDMLSDDGAEVALFNGQPRACRSDPVLDLASGRAAICRCLAARHVNATAMNDRSSRSHVIMMLNLQEEQDGGACVTSSLYLVDLAGSESVKKSLATGKVAAEAGKINTSLLALKNVILALSSTEQPTAASVVGLPRTHVPYRDSKLTELLQDSIGGSARTVFIACISLLGRDQDETKSTLDYASRARTIKNVANSERQRLSCRLRSTEAELQKAKNMLQGKVDQKGGIWVPKEAYEEFVAAKEAQIDSARLMEELIQERDACLARQNVAMSQIEIFKATVQKQQVALQAARDAQVAAVESLKRGCAGLEQCTTQALACALEESQTQLRRFGEAGTAAVAVVERGAQCPELAQRLQCAWVAATSAHALSAQLTVSVIAELSGCIERLTTAAKREAAALEGDVRELIARRFRECHHALDKEAGMARAHAEEQVATARREAEATIASCASGRAFTPFVEAAGPTFPQLGAAIRLVLQPPTGAEMARIVQTGKTEFVAKSTGVVEGVVVLLEADPRDISSPAIALAQENVSARLNASGVARAAPGAVGAQSASGVPSVGSRVLR